MTSGTALRGVLELIFIQFAHAVSPLVMLILRMAAARRTSINQSIAFDGDASRQMDDVV
jgi:hypothetical protein